MKVTELKVNGIKNPVGFSFPHVKISWKVTEFTDKEQSLVKIKVADDEQMEHVLTEKTGVYLDSIGELVELNLQPYTRYFYQVTVSGDQGEMGSSDVGYFETGKMQEAWQGKFIGTEETDKFHPVFMKKFQKPASTSKARIYVTGLGLYEAYLNGHKIGDDYLAPFCNDYNKKIQYQTYDITEMLEAENEICIYTGNGWYKGRIGYEGDQEFYGNRFSTIAEIHMWDEDGVDVVIPTDETWTYKASDIAMSDLYDGEVLDRTLENDTENQEKPVQILGANSQEDADHFNADKLVERYSVPVVVKEEVAVKEIIHTPAGETVLDLGQNFAGYMTFQADFEKGTKIVLDFGEILQNGNFYNDNYRTAKAQFTYISDGRTELVRPHFTYYGFRYVRVTGWPGKVKKEDFMGQAVYSDLDETVEFSSSSEKLNRLYLNCFWGQKSNFVDMPTDCPQRDERFGWTGDAQVFSPTASFQMDTRAFYRKYLSDLRLDQLDHEGAIAGYILNNGSAPSGSSVWGDAATFIPMTLYHCYGDKEDLTEYYPMMKDWVEYIIREDQAHGDHHLWNFGFHFGDWLAQDGVTPQSMKGGTDDGFVASVYYYASAKKMAEAAIILGKTEDARRYKEKAEQVHDAMLREYYTENGRLAIDTQTAYLLSLKFGIYRTKERIIEGFKVRLKKDCYKIKGGFVGATMMCQVLAENGMEDMAYYILFQEGFPGWMHCINLGATTIWERWNSVLDDGSISGTGMNSLNHYSYGSVMEYVYRYIAGVNETKPGFKEVRFAPQLNGKLNHVRFAYNSVSGTYVSEWNILPDGKVKVHFEVPFGCKAIVVLPGTDGKEVDISAGSYEKTYEPNVDYRKKYTMDSRLEEFALDPDAMAIIQKELPIAAGLIASQDAENLSLSLNELQFMFFMGFNPDMVQKAAEKILELEYHYE